MSWDEISDSLKASIYDRGKSPFYGSFIISWLGWNWRLVFSLFGDGKQDFANRITIINETYVSWLTNLVYPLLTAATVFVVGNFLTSFFLRIKFLFSNHRRGKIQKLELLDEKQTENMWKRIGKKEIEINRLLIDKIAEIESYHSINQELNQKISTMESENLVLQTEILKVNKVYEELKTKIEEKNINTPTFYPPLTLDQYGNKIDEDKVLKEEYNVLKTSIFYDSFVTFLLVMANEKTSSFAREKLVRSLANSSYSRKEGYQKFDDLKKIEVISINDKYDVCNLSEKGKMFASFFIEDNLENEVNFSNQELSKVIGT